MKKTGGVPRYRHRKLTPGEYATLRKRAGLSIRDVMYLTGRHSAQVAEFHGEVINPKRPRQEPMMADVMVIELIARNPANFDLAQSIADEYSLGAQEEKEPSR